jgi:metal-responsive CopG/Arc/MetJ family transcriptional regulator
VRITLDDELVDQLDSRVGRRRRSAFISETVRRALDDERRWEEIEAGSGALAEREHDCAAIDLALRRLDLEPMSRAEALAMQGTGWEGDLEELRGGWMRQSFQAS